ncbi:MAG: histidine phosphatase family protein [Anaerolineaceae bacterium]
MVLIRHAMPRVTPGTASTLWTLGESAKEDCVLLAHAVPENIAPVIYTSPEPKAAETAAVIALRLSLQVVNDARLSEVDRPPVWDEDYRSMVLSYLHSGVQLGWEPANTVLARFTAAVDEALDTHPVGDLIVSDHGMALSLYAASVAKIDLREFWAQLTFPDAWRLDVEMKTLERLYFGGLAPE